MEKICNEKTKPDGTDGYFRFFLSSKLRNKAVSDRKHETLIPLIKQYTKKGFLLFR
jgi:hypothetical protein